MPVLVAHTGFWSVLAILTGALGFHRGANLVLHIWGAGILWFCGVKIKKFGMENIPRVALDPQALREGERGVLFLFNHQSFFDIFALHAIFTERVRFGAKIELFKIPIFGFAMRAVGVLPIARKKRAVVMQVYRNAEEKFANSWSFVLAPEGTRQHKPVVGQFKKGPFIFAINAQATIVPVVLRGSFHVFPRDGWLMNVGRWRRTIEVHFLAKIETRDLTIEQCDALMTQTRNDMLAVYEAGELEG